MSTSDIDSGDTGFLLFATTLVMLQTPGMGLTQAGLIRQKNALSMLMQTFLGMAIGSVLWWVCGFSLTFGPSGGGFIGNPFEYWMFTGLTLDEPLDGQTIPSLLYASFQMMFALMVPLIISGRPSLELSLPLQL